MYEHEIAAIRGHAGLRKIPLRANRVSTIMAWVSKPEPNKRTYRPGEVTFEKSAHMSGNSRPQHLVQHTANKFRLIPRNIKLAGLEIFARRRANDLVGKQRNQTMIDWCKSRQRPQPVICV